MLRTFAVLFLAVLFVPLSVAGRAGADDRTYAPPLAHYPLSSDGADATGNNAPMTLVNVIFNDGGLACNGISSNTEDGSQAETPHIEGFDFNSIAFSVEFKLPAYPTEGHSRPIIVGGKLYRWMGAEINWNGQVKLLYNNSMTVTSVRGVTLNEWHELVLAYSTTSHVGRLYVDGEQYALAEFVMQHGDDSDICITNWSTAACFLGWIRELVVYPAAYDPTPVEETTWGRIKALCR